MAIINKQFLNENPELLEFPVDLAYESQFNAIDSSVKGWIRASKTDLQGNSLHTPPTPPKGKTNNTPKEEEEEDKEKEEYIYKENDFLYNWNLCRTHYLKKPSFIKTITSMDRINFNNALKHFSKEDVNNAMHGLFKQQNMTIGAMTLQPKHFLENIDKYYNAEMSKEYTLYGKDRLKTEL